MLDIFTKLGDLIAPPHPAVAQIRTETKETFARFYDPEPVGDAIALSHFIIPRVHAAVTANKFCDYEPAADLLASFLERWLTAPPAHKTILVPIPLGPKRQKERGYNQVERVAKRIRLPNTSVAHLIKRPEDTAPQTTLGRTARLENLKGAFVANPTPDKLTGTRIIILDDVITTGATLTAAKAALLPHLPSDCELVCVALAH